MGTMDLRAKIITSWPRRLKDLRGPILVSEWEWIVGVEASAGKTVSVGRTVAVSGAAVGDGSLLGGGADVGTPPEQGYSRRLQG